MYVPEVHGEFVLARVEFIQSEGQKAMKWVGIDPGTGADIHWTLYHKLGSQGPYNFLIGKDGKSIAEVSTLDEAPYTDEGPLKQRLAKWRHVLTLHHNQEEFDEFFENE